MAINRYTLAAQLAREAATLEAQADWLTEHPDTALVVASMRRMAQRLRKHANEVKPKIKRAGKE